MTRITDERLAELLEYWEEYEDSPLAEDREVAAALRELQQLRACHREVICRRCGLRDRLGEVPNADF